MDVDGSSPVGRVLSVVERLFVERSTQHSVLPDEDLRTAGLTSLDMVSLVLSVEAEFCLMIPEASIIPTNFRSVATISAMISALQRGS